jgi:hypothetical protein
MYRVDPDGLWALKYVIESADPPAELIRDGRNGNLADWTPLAIARQALVLWIKAQQVPIEKPVPKSESDYVTR